MNIKVALAEPVRSGKLSMPGRDELLTSMTEDVSALVLRTNYQQTLALSLARGAAWRISVPAAADAENLEQRSFSTGRGILPDDMTLGERAKRAEALTRPELSVLLAYAKLTLYSELLDSPVQTILISARDRALFPARSGRAFSEALQITSAPRDHRNTTRHSIINRGGPSLIVRIADQTGATSTAIAQAFAAVRDSYSMTAFNTDIDALDNKVAGDVQLELYRAVQDLLLDPPRLVPAQCRSDARACGNRRALSRRHRRRRCGARKVLSKEISDVRDARQRELLAAKVPKNWPGASPIAGPDICNRYRAGRARSKRPVADVAATYFAVNAHFRIAPLIAARARHSGHRTISIVSRSTAHSIPLRTPSSKINSTIVSGGESGPTAVAPGQGGAAKIDRIRDSIHQIAATGLTLSKLTVAASLLGDLAGA